MTISNVTCRVDYTGDGAHATYAYTFPIVSDSDLLVTTRLFASPYTETTLLLITDYTVVGAGEVNGGTITLVAGNLANGNLISISRNPPLTQATDIRNQGPFYPAIHEDEFDRLITQIQRLDAVIDRCIKIPETEVFAASTTILPQVGDRASRVFGWDPSGRIDMSTAANASGPFVVAQASVDLPLARVLTGTANQVIVTDNGGGVTIVLSLPQNIHSAATPLFAGLKIGVVNLSSTGAVNFSYSSASIYSRNQANTADVQMLSLSANGANANAVFIGNQNASEVVIIPGSVPTVHIHGDGTTSALAHTLAVYNTFTAGTPDYERLELTWSSNIGKIRTNANGTGTTRTMALCYGGSNNLAVTIGTAVNGGLTLSDAAASSSFANGRLSIARGSATTVTAGTCNSLLLNETTTDGGTNSTTVHNLLNISPTVNYTAASKTGKVYLAYLNPTLTSQPTGNNAGLVFSSAFTSSTFPAVRFFNTADEDTNPEWGEIGWHVLSNQFTLRTSKAGSGTGRYLSFCRSATTNQLLRIPISAGEDILMGLESGATVYASGRVSIGRTATLTATSGTHVELLVNGSPAPSSTSTMAFYGVQVNPTINYSAGTPGAGYVYGLYVAPILTATPTGRSAGISLALTASTLGGLVFNNQADEQTNFEQGIIRFTGNEFVISSSKGGTGTNRNILIDPGTADVKYAKALVALGGGAAPTFGTIGGTGPATAAQNSWKRELDSTGAAYWVPTWK